VRTLDLMCQRKDPQAIAYAETALVEHPGSAEIQFALGEARWHAGMFERAVQTLERAYDLDPRWQMALHHVIEYRLSRGEGEKLRPIANSLASLDPPRAGALECQIGVAEHHYEAAAGRAQSALLLGEPIPDLYVCLSQAQVLAGHLDRAEQTIRNMNNRWPIDLREWGGLMMETELLLYRGRYADYQDTMTGRASRLKDMALMLWDPTFAARSDSQDKAVHPASVTNAQTMRPPPLQFAQVLIAEHLRGHDPVEVYDQESYPEVRAFGRGLAAELKGDLIAATNEYRRALSVSAKGDMKMIAAYALAKLLDKRGDTAGARDACRDVIAPSQYYPYRAVLLPDCILWSHDRVWWKWLADAWTGEFHHPAVDEIRKRMGAGKG
jgi:tetratricopeptide (TPR) repeat protein